jgi:RNA polymerase II subunit A-like phosphatase
MATRAYAREVAKIIDPDHKYFGDRIVSRDESGSISHKFLQRIFPIDTKLVVIIDDRADVWQWSPNLIKVNPYCFFVGTGDINAMYLPKQTNGSAASSAAASTSSDDSKHATAPDAQEGESPVPNGTQPATDTEEITDIEQRLVAMASAGAEDLKEQVHKQEEMKNEQITERPLQKMQEMLDKQGESEASSSESSSDTGEMMELEKSPTPKHRHSLLHDNDEELIYLQDTLERVHKTFFDEYDRAAAGSHGGRVAALRGERAQKVRPENELQLVPDIKDIIPHMRSNVLKGVVICFTGVIPQGIDHQLSDLGMWARSFGAVVQQNLTKSTTHVIAHRERRTSKVRQASKYPWMKIVAVSWLTECFSRWRRVSEKPHVIEVEGDHHGSQEPLPFDELDDGVVLSDSDSTGEDALPDDAANEDATPEDEEEPMSALDRNPIRDDEWDAMHAEVDAWLQEELESGDEDGDMSDSSVQSYHSSSSRSQHRQTKDARKRKREDTESAENSDDTDGSAAGDGSELQKRKKRALERTTGLANVSVADKSSGLPSPETTGAEEENPDDDDFAAAFVAGLEEAEENVQA